MQQAATLTDIPLRDAVVEGCPSVMKPLFFAKVPPHSRSLWLPDDEKEVHENVTTYGAEICLSWQASHA
jgi:hypothetical protein